MKNNTIALTFTKKAKLIMQNISNKKKNKLFILTILLISIILFGIWYFCFQEEGSHVVIEINGEITQRFPLNENITYTIHSASDGINELVIWDNKAYIREANCENQDCVYAKPVSKVGESIICLPHKVNIYIEDNKSDTHKQYDAIAN